MRIASLTQSFQLIIPPIGCPTIPLIVQFPAINAPLANQLHLLLILFDEILGLILPPELILNLLDLILEPVPLGPAGIE